MTELTKNNVLKFRRINHKTGQEYSFEGALQGKRTVIATKDASLTVDANIEEVNQAYYQWQNQGKAIQEAFRFLSTEQREFILSGITPEKWKEIFAGEEE